MAKTQSHYDYLEAHLPTFFKKLGLDWNLVGRGIIVAHGDKCYGYRTQWEAAGIPFAHGVALYLLTYCSPFAQEVRETTNGWVAPSQWVIDNYSRYRELLPEE